MNDYMDVLALFLHLLLEYIIAKSTIFTQKIPNSLHFWVHSLFIFWHTINIKIQAWNRWVQQQKNSKHSKTWSTNAGRLPCYVLAFDGDWIQCHPIHIIFPLVAGGDGVFVISLPFFFECHRALLPWTHQTRYNVLTRAFFKFVLNMKSLSDMRKSEVVNAHKHQHSYT